LFQNPITKYDLEQGKIHTNVELPHDVNSLAEVPSSLYNAVSHALENPLSNLTYSPESMKSQQVKQHKSASGIPRLSEVEETEDSSWRFEPMTDEMEVPWI